MNSLKSFAFKYPWLLILVLGLIVYAQAFFNPFVWDDQELIVNNALIKTSNFVSYALSGGNFNSGGARILIGNYYKPLMSITYGINYRFWGLNPFGYHLFQVLLHIINSSLVFYLFKKLFQLAKYNAAITMAFIGSLIFLVHPLSIEAVGYIAATQEILYTFFTLAALLLILFFSKHRLNGFVQIFIFTLLIFLSLFSKESGLIVILLGLVSCFLFARKSIVPFLFSSVIAFIAYAFLRFHFLGFSLPWKGIFPMMNASLTQRLITIPKEFTYYMANFFYPHNLAISQHWLVKEMTMNDFYFPLILLIFFIALVIFVAIKLKSKIFIFFTVWFFASIGMVLNIIPLDMTVADRWFYFPMIGLLGMIMIIIVRLNETITAIPLLLFIIFIPLLSIRTFIRLDNWKSPLSLYSHDAKVNPDAFDLENNLGTELFRLGKFEEAKIHFAKSFNLLPAWWVSANNLGASYDHQGDLENAEKYYRLAIANDSYYLAYENLAFLLLEKGKNDEVLAFTKRGLTIFPNNPRLILALTLGLYQKGEKGGAHKWAEYLYRIEPTDKNKQLLNSLEN